MNTVSCKQSLKVGDKITVDTYPSEYEWRYDGADGVKESKYYYVFYVSSDYVYIANEDTSLEPYNGCGIINLKRDKDDNTVWPTTWEGENIRIYRAWLEYMISHNIKASSYDRKNFADYGGGYSMHEWLSGENKSDARVILRLLSQIGLPIKDRS